MDMTPRVSIPSVMTKDQLSLSVKQLDQEEYLEVTRPRTGPNPEDLSPIKMRFCSQLPQVQNTKSKTMNTPFIVVVRLDRFSVRDMIYSLRQIVTRMQSVQVPSEQHIRPMRKWEI